MPKTRYLYLSLFILSTGISWGLPQYAARSARICANCHSDPYETKSVEAWKNPDLSERKCNMSCQGCHINPAGGGIRNVPGRYYAASTLPMLGAKGRPRADRENLSHPKVLDWVRAVTGKKKRPYRKLPLEETTVQKRNSFFYSDDFLSLGSPLFTSDKQSTYAYDWDRYGSLNADPFLTLGADIRMAWWRARGGNFAFPMQVEAGGALHPVEHITFSGTAALQGRTRGFRASKEDSLNNPVKLQNAFVLIHELPYMAYVQGGWFLPEFGIRVDDHTLFNRKYFEMDPSVLENTVRGVQGGLAPNYPYFSYAWFETLDENLNTTGTGSTVNAYWRGILAGVGASGMMKTRAFDDGGDLLAGSFNGYVNLWSLWKKARYKHPLIWQFEYNLGKGERTSESERYFHTGFMQWDYLLVNGINLKTNYTWYDADFELKDDFVQRFGGGVDWNFYRGFRLTYEIRGTVAESFKGSKDMILFLHGFL